MTDPDEKPDRHVRTSFGETIDEQAELEELIREKGSFQAAVDAQRRGERPKRPPENVSGA